MKKITLLFFILTISFGYSQSLPIDFDDPLDANFVPQGNNTFAVVMDGANNVGQTTSGDAQYDSRVDLGLDTYVDMTTANKTFTFEFYTSEAVVMNGLFQLGNKEAGGANVWPIEMTFSTDGNIGWETITLDFTNATNGYPNAGQPVEYGQYAQVSVFTNFADTGTSTYWFDDIAGAVNGAAVPAPPTPIDYLSVDFETATSFGAADGAVYTDLTTNTVTDGENSSVTAGEISACSAGPYSHIFLNISDGFNFSADKGFSIKVKGPRAVPILFKLQQGDAYQINHEVGGNYTTPGVWQEILFDFTPFTSTNMTRIVLFFDITGAASVDPNDDKFQVDDLVFDLYSTLGTSNFEVTEFNVFPNPSLNAWNIKTNNTVINAVNVFDILGKQVISLSPESTEVKIDGSSLTSGIYIAKIATPQGVSNVRLVRK